MPVDLFQRRDELAARLRYGQNLRPVVARMAGTALLCALVYGLVLGAQIGGWQVVSSPIKLPLILLGTGTICIAALYVLLALAGAHLRWSQVIGMALCSITASGMLMAAVLPVTAFWTMAFGREHTATTLIHTVAFAVCGLAGSRFGMEMARAVLPERRYGRVLFVWFLLYGLVGQQMAWMFRPHFTRTQVFMRPLDSGGSALESIGKTLLGLP